MNRPFDTSSATTREDELQVRPDADTPWLRDFSDPWMNMGPETKDVILRLLPADWSFAGKRVLDFGSGPGRTLKEFLPEASDGEFWGIDVDSASIDALRSSLVPPMHAATCGYLPPLGLEADSFDLAWAISVFTHMTENSLPWLLELNRILKPGGYLIASYLGEQASEFAAGEAWDEDRIGMNVLRHSHPWDDGGPLVLISDWWLREHWGRAFEIVQLVHGIQRFGWAVLRKRDVALSPEQLAEPSADPRELAAVKHNLAQAQREIEITTAIIHALQGQADQRVDAIRHEYENSVSFRVTRPLRKLGGAVRARRTGR